MVAETRQRVDEALSDAAATLERLDVARTLNEAKMRSETELLREALIGSVSHELRTPLASILGAATVLTQSPADRQGRAPEVARLAWCTTRRSGSTTTSRTCSTRRASAATRSSRGWNGSSRIDIVNSALERRRRRLSSHSIAVEMDSNLPFIYVDPVLVEQAFVQIVDNAAKYSPAGLDHQRRRETQWP